MQQYREFGKSFSDNSKQIDEKWVSKEEKISFTETLEYIIRSLDDVIRRKHDPRLSFQFHCQAGKQGRPHKKTDTFSREKPHLLKYINP